MTPRARGKLRVTTKLSYLVAAQGYGVVYGGAPEMIKW